MSESLTRRNTGRAILEIAAVYPDFVVFGGLQEESPPIKVVALLSSLVPGLPPVDGGLEISELEFLANPRLKTFSVQAEVQKIWSFSLDFLGPDKKLEISSLELELDYAPQEVAVKLVGEVVVIDKTFILTADKPAAGSWIFSGELAPDDVISVPALVNGVIGAAGGTTIDLSHFGLAELDIKGLFFQVDTGDPKSYAFRGALEWDTGISLTGGDNIVVQAAVDIRKEGNLPVAGTIGGSVSTSIPYFENFKLSAIYAFGQGATGLAFELELGRLRLRATYEKTAAETILTFTIPGDLTFGDLLTALVGLVDPSVEEFVLEPPWDLLDKISLSGLSLVVNTTRKTVTVKYETAIDLGFMTINSLGFTYKDKPQRSVYLAVDLSIAGAPSQAQEFDALNESPPEVPGKGVAVFDVTYLGLGQHVSLAPDIVARLENIGQVMDALRGNAPQPALSDRNRNPLELPDNKLQFNASSDWLIGAQMQLLRTLDLTVIFNDPLIYGLRIELSGDAAKVFAGLKFEILYRKVTDTIGVYHVDLTLPDLMRYLQFGAVSITLPIVVLDIYTNGDFKVDFGFPWNSDFSRSFGVEVLPFTGSGGFYFNKLSAATATSTPAVTNGVFTPVYEFGLGLRIGLGKSFNKGPLSAELSITVQGIIEGVISWFNANEPRALPAPWTGEGRIQYFALQGSVSIVGRLYGKVDFVVISVEVEVLVRVTVRFAFEVYQPIHLTLEAYVSVKASVKVLFIRISFSFKMTVSAEFTIGSAEPTPWILERSVGARALPGGAIRALARAPRPVDLARDLRPMALLDWASAPVWAGEEKKPLDAFFQPAFTRSASGIEGVALLFLENSIPVDAQGHEGHADAAAANDTDFDLLVQALLAWAVYAHARATGAPSEPPEPLSELTRAVTLADLEDLHRAVSARSDSASSPFDLERLSAFLAANFSFDITDSRSDLSGTVFPMFPQLSMQVGDADEQRFDAASRKLSAADVAELKAYFQELRVGRSDPAVAGPPAAGTQPAATFIFVDYFRLLVRSAAQSAVDLLRARLEASQGASPVEIDPATVELPLEELLETLNRNGAFNHIAAMASRFLLHGLRLPAGGAVDSATTPLFRETAQQFTLAATEDADLEELTVTLRDPESLEWITFTDTTADGTATEDAAELVFRLEDFPDLVSLVQQLRDLETPGEALPAALPEPLPFYVDAPRRFSLRKKIGWQATLADGETATTLPLMELPQDLRAWLEAGGDTGSLTLEYGTPRPGRTELEIERRTDYAWATQIPLTVRRVPSAAGAEFLEGTYLMVGADESGKEALEDIWARISEVDEAPPSLYLLQRADGGLVNHPSAESLLLKTNLSTESGPAGGLTRSLRAGALGASPGEAADFLRLLWEGSTVGTGGYYLDYRYLQDGSLQGLPEELFGDGLEATLVLLVLHRRPDAQGTPRAILPFQNAVVLAADVNLEAGVLFAESSEPVKTLNVLPGHLGLRMTRPDATHADPTPSGREELAALYQLLGLRVTDNDDFRKSRRGLPIGPLENDADGDDLWLYERVVPVHALAKSRRIADRPGLPAAAANPYSGIGATAEVEIEFVWQDLYGNRLGDDAESRKYPVRYVDPLVGINQWPSLAESYRFVAADDGAVSLEVELAFDAARFVASPTDVESKRDEIRAALETYQRVYYQLHQPDLELSVHTSVVAGPGEPFGATRKKKLTDLVDAIFAYLTALEPDPAGASPPPPAPLVLSFALLDAGEAPSHPEQLVFPVSARIEMARSADLTDPDVVREVPEVEKVSAVLNAGALSGRAGAEANDVTDVLRRFAADFEAAFPGLRLAVGSERTRNNPAVEAGEADSGLGKPLWAVRLGEGGVDYSVDPTSPLYFAPAPLATTLLAGSARVPGYVRETGLNPPAEREEQRFEAIDLNVLARDFLVAVDGFLQPETAVPAYDRVAGDKVTAIIRHKRTLAEAIGGQVTHILETTPAPADVAERRAAAAEKLRQRLLVSLVEGYDIETIVQYEVVVDDPDGLLDAALDRHHAPRLSGQPVVESARRTSRPDRSVETNTLDFALSPAKVPLARGSSYLTFLFDTKTPERYEDLTLTLDYRVNELEHALHDVTGIADYQASSWLTFVLPRGGGAGDRIGDAEIPIPLRTYPMPPSLALHRAEADPDSQKRLEDVRQWQYSFTYEHLDVAQDTIECGVLFNSLVAAAAAEAETEPEDEGAAETDQDLFGALVSFSKVYPRLVPELKLLRQDPDGNADAIAAALGALEELVGAVASAWSAWVSAPAPDVAEAEEARYQIDEVIPTEETKEVTVTIDAGNSLPTSPQVVLPGYRRDPGPPAEGTSGGDRTLTYSFTRKSAEEAALDPVFGESSIPDRTVIVPDLDIIDQQNAWASVWLARNKELIAEAETNPAFVFETARTRFSSMVTPLLINDESWDVAALGSADGSPRKDTLANHVRRLFDTLLPAKPAHAYDLRVNCRYAFALASGGQAAADIVSALPILLGPRFTIGEGQNGLAATENLRAAMVVAIENWRDAKRPAKRGAMYIFGVSLFSNLDPDDTIDDTNLPVLKIEDLRLRLEDVE